MNGADWKNVKVWKKFYFFVLLIVFSDMFSMFFPHNISWSWRRNAPAFQRNQSAQHPMEAFRSDDTS